MAKSLIIAEKPSVAKDIAKVLGSFTDQKEFLESERYVISWAVGHLFEFVDPQDIDEKYKAWKLEDLPIIPEKFQYRAKKNCLTRITNLKKLLKRSDIVDVIDACDAGREGELIFREIIDNCGCTKPTKRLWLQSMTPEAIREAFARLQPGSDYDNLGDAAVCRSEADWLVGINTTRAITKRFRSRNDIKSWSAGRVQTPTLAMVAERELEILSFRPTPFWSLKGTFSAPDSSAGAHSYEGTWYDPSFKESEDDPRRKNWIVDQKHLREIMAAVKNQVGTVTETRVPKSESAPPLFDLTSLQREANKRFGMSAKMTLDTAQRLYESRKLITYPRTASKCLPKDYRQPVYAVLNSLAQYAGQSVNGKLDFPIYVRAANYLKANDLKNGKRIFDDSKITDHFAIIPTQTSIPHDLSEAEAKVFDLIIRRFLAAFFPNAEYIQIDRETVIADQHFHTSAKYLNVAGWQSVYGKAELVGEKASQYLPPLAGKQPSRNTNLEEKQDQTKPKGRMSEAGLLSRMENAGREVDDSELQNMLKSTGGLGTPATRAETIETLKTREYIEYMDHALRATTKGIMLIDLLQRIGIAGLTSPAMTAEMEMQLMDMEQGNRPRPIYMKEIVDYTSEIIDKAKAFEYDMLYAQDEPLGECPCCHQGRVIENTRFYHCEYNNNKDSDPCKFIIWKDKSGRYLDRVTVKELLTQGKTAELVGFPGSNGSSYQARLCLNPQTFEVEFLGERTTAGGEVPPELVELPVDTTPVCACPYDAECKVIETGTHYQCEKKCVASGKHKNGFVLPRIVCHRQMSRADVIPYITNGKSELIEDFISRFNKPFKGYLVLKPTGKHGFEFLPRASKRKAATSDDAESTATTTAKRTTRKKAEATGTATATTKRTTRKKADAEGTATATTKRTTRKKAEAEGAVAAPTKRATRKKAVTVTVVDEPEYVPGGFYDDL